MSIPKAGLTATIALLLLGGVARCHSSESVARVGRIGIPACPSIHQLYFGQAGTPILPVRSFASSASAGSPADKATRIQQSKAFWKSLLIPGLGQLSMGRKAAGYSFLTAEIALIGSLVGLRTYATRMENDYHIYASQHAGISSGHEHMYYVDIGNWMNERDYNEERLRDRDFEALYQDPLDAWSWDSDTHRSTFKNMRLDSDQARNTAVLVVGGMLVNHLFSAIDAARSSGKQPSLSFEPDLRGGGKITMSLTR